MAARLSLERPARLGSGRDGAAQDPFDLSIRHAAGPRVQCGRVRSLVLLRVDPPRVQGRAHTVRVQIPLALLRRHPAHTVRVQGRALPAAAPASSGIGAQIARELACRGFDLILVARRGDRLAALQQELQALSLVHAKRKADVRMFPYDLSKPDDVASLCSELASLPVAILVGVTRALRARGRRWRTLSRDPT